MLYYAIGITGILVQLVVLLYTFIHTHMLTDINSHIHTNINLHLHTPTSSYINIGTVAMHTTCYEHVTKVLGLKATNSFWHPKYYDPLRPTITKQILFINDNQVFIYVFFHCIAFKVFIEIFLDSLNCSLAVFLGVILECFSLDFLQS